MERGRAANRSEDPQATDVISIEALGGLRVSVGDRSLELSSQPFRCALLLYLVIERKTTRRQLIQLLWPGKDPPRARRSLSQTLYELKRELQAPLVDSAREVIEVADNVEVDVSRFLNAVDLEDAHLALELYDGPFLGSVHLPTTVPFEHWAEKLRGNLERQYARMCSARLERLAAEEDWEQAVRVARGWTERDHLKDEAWHHLIQALWMTGRSREALASYEWFKAALRRELDVSPIEDTEALVARIRERIEQRVPPAPAEGETPPRVVLAAGPEGRGMRSRGPLWMLSGLLLGALLLSIFLTKTGDPLPPEARVIVVAPMSVVGDVPPELATGVPSLVAAVLDQLDGIRTMGPMRYASVASEAGLSNEPDAVIQVGQLLQANSALEGSLISAGNNVRGELVLRSSLTGAAVAYASASAPADSASQLVDSLALGLLRDIWRADDALPSMRVSAITSAHPQALRHYIRGEEHFIHARWDSAQSEFHLATLADSEFALAHFRYSESVSWGQAFGITPRQDRAAPAYRYRDRLPARERALVTMDWLDAAGRVEAIDSARAFLDRYPDDPEGWYELGDARVHAWKLIPTENRSLLEPFDRAATLEPAFSRVYIHPLQISAAAGDQRLFTDYLERFRASTGGTDTSFDGWSQALWGQPTEVLQGLQLAFENGERNPPPSLIHAYLVQGRQPPDLVVEALDFMASQSSGEPRDRWLRLEAQVLAALGRVDEASGVLAPLFDSDPLTVSLGVVEMASATGVLPALEPRVRAFLESQPDHPTAAIWLAWLDLVSGQVELAREHLLAVPVPDDQVAGLVEATAGWADVESGDVSAGLARMKAGLFRAGYAHSAGPLLWAYECFAATTPEMRAEALERFRFSRAGLEYLVPRMVERAAMLAGPNTRPERDLLEAQIRHLWGQADLEVTAGGRRPPRINDRP